VPKETVCFCLSLNREHLIKELGPNKVTSVCEELSKKFHLEINNLVTGEMDLRELVRTIMFPAVVQHMFGDDLLPDEKVLIN